MLSDFVNHSAKCLKNGFSVGSCLGGRLIAIKWRRSSICLSVPGLYVLNCQWQFCLDLQNKIRDWWSLTTWVHGPPTRKWRNRLNPISRSVAASWVVKIFTQCLLFYLMICSNSNSSVFINSSSLSKDYRQPRLVCIYKNKGWLGGAEVLK